MKTLRLIVSIRLAFFPIIFNLTFADEVGVVSEESSSRTSETEVNDPENEILVDSLRLIQNDEQDIQDSQQN